MANLFGDGDGNFQSSSELPIHSSPGHFLYCSGTFTHKGAAFDPWIAVYFGLNRHRELGLWPMRVLRASYLGVIVGDDETETTYSWTLVLTITPDMAGKTFDVLRVVAKDEPAADASNLSSVRWDDDWDDNVLQVEGE